MYNKIKYKTTKKITVIISVVCMMSSCGIQFGNYERYKEINRNNTCQDEVTQEDYYVNCENCDEID